MGNLIGSMLKGFIFLGMSVVRFTADNQLSLLPILSLNKSVLTLNAPSRNHYLLVVKFIAANKIITVSIIFIAFSAGHV